MAIDYDKKTWGTYTWDEELTVAQNVSAARNANALIESSDLQRIENAVAELADQEDPASPADLDTLGYIPGVFIESGGVVPPGLPEYSLIIEMDD